MAIQTWTEYRIWSKAPRERTWKWRAFSMSSHRDVTKLQAYITKMEVDPAHRGWKFKIMSREVTMGTTDWVDSR